MQRIADTIVFPASAGDALIRALRSFALLRESGVGMIGAAIIAFWVLTALLAPWIAPFEPNATLMPFAMPGAAFDAGGTFWLGTDQIGRDILSPIIWGSRTVLFYAPLATLSAYILGILMGVVAGYRGGWWDVVLSRISDIILSFPVLVLYIIIIATFGASGINIVIPITFASSPGLMPLLRGLVLDLPTRAYGAAPHTRARGRKQWGR